MAVDEFVPGPYRLQRACSVDGCGSHDFDIDFKAGTPHLTGTCLACGSKLPGGQWVSRSEIGLRPARRRRDGFAPEVRMEVMQRWQHRCAWCGVPATESRLEIGHIIPRAQIIPLYGDEIADHFLNLAPSCPDCNSGAHLTSVPAINLLLASIRIGANV